MGQGWLFWILLFALNLRNWHVTIVDLDLAFEIEGLVSRGANHFAAQVQVNDSFASLED